MAVTTTEAMLIAEQLADLMNRMSKEQWERFQAGMLMSNEPDYSQQQIMNGFATMISEGHFTTWSWDERDQLTAAEAERERQRQIDRGQLQMFPENEGWH